MHSAKFEWSLLFPDKSAVSAPTALGILARIADMQMDPCSIPQIRARLVDRAFVWSGVMVSESTTAEQFLRDLSSVGMFALMEPPVVYNGHETETGSVKEGD